MFVQRTLLADIQKWLDTEKILLIKGSRQVGKTTILKYLEQHLKKEHPTLLFSIDLEIGNPLFKEPKLFIKFLESHTVKGKRLYVFLDEFDREVASLGESDKFMAFLEERSEEESDIPLKEVVKRRGIGFDRNKNFLFFCHKFIMDKSWQKCLAIAPATRVLWQYSEDFSKQVSPIRSFSSTN